MTSLFSSISNLFTQNTEISAPDVTSISTTENRENMLSLLCESSGFIPDKILYEHLRRSADENLPDTIVIIFHIRDCRGGKGERELGIKALIWLFLNYPSEFMKVTSLIPMYGRWDDYLRFFPSVLDPWAPDENIGENIDRGLCAFYQTCLVNSMGIKLKADLLSMKKGLPVSLCAKWAPSEKDSMDRRFCVVRALCLSMNISFKTYRTQYLSPLRSYLKIVEKYMCENKWENINYSSVPFYAMKKLERAFERHNSENYKKWSISSSEKINDSSAHELFDMVKLDCKETPIMVSEECGEYNNWNTILYDKRYDSVRELLQI